MKRLLGCAASIVCSHIKGISLQRVARDEVRVSVFVPDEEYASFGARATAYPRLRRREGKV